MLELRRFCVILLFSNQVLICFHATEVRLPVPELLHRARHHRGVVRRTRVLVVRRARVLLARRARRADPARGSVRNPPPVRPPLASVAVRSSSRAHERLETHPGRVRS